MKQQLTLAWTLVTVLTILLAIAGYFLSNPQLKNQNMTQIRDQIREHCAADDAVSKEKCAQDLQDLTDLIRTLNEAKGVKTN